MSRIEFRMYSPADYDRLVSYVPTIHRGSKVTITEPRRTIPQNSMMWDLLDDLSKQVKWHGVTLSREDWKILLLDALTNELRPVPNIDGTGFVNLGRSSSRLSKEEMSGMIELIFKFGAERGVVFHDTGPAA